MPHSLHGCVSFLQAISPPYCGNYVGRPKSQTRLQLPIFFNHRPAKSIGAKRHIISGAMLDLHLSGALQNLDRNSGQTGAAIALGGVKYGLAWIVLLKNFQRFIDQEHARGRDRSHALEMITGWHKVRFWNGIAWHIIWDGLGHFLSP